MSNLLFSRREFSRTIGQSLGLALAAQGLHGVLAASSTGADGSAPRLIELNYNENPYGPSPKAREALGTCGNIAARYPDQAREKMRAVLAESYGVKPENILLGCGSTEIIRTADRAFLAPGQGVVVAEPTFEAVLEYASVAHAIAVKVPLTTDHRHDLPKMAAACTSKIGLVYVCNPNNPTGTIVTRDELSAFIEGVPPSTLILVDEAYFDFADDPQYASATAEIEKHPNVVVARTFSKIYGLAGMRLGYGVGAKETIARMSEHLLQDNCNAAVLSAVQASLADVEYTASVRARLIESRRWLEQELRKSGFAFIPSQANFIMIDMRTDVEPVIRQFHAHNILVGRRFPSMSNFLRVTIGTQPEMEEFVAALREISSTSVARAA